MLIAIGVSVCIVLTNSRNAWGGLILSVPIVLGPSVIYWLICFMGVIGSLLLITYSSEFLSNLKFIFDSLIPDKILMEFTESNFLERETRLKIWIYGMKLISEKPFIGWGAAVFPILYSSKYETRLF